MQKILLKKRLLKILSLILISQFISCSLGLPEPHSLKFDAATFNPLANEIINQNQVFEMDDFSRYYKSINNVLIRFDKTRRDSFDNSKFFDDVVDSLKIDRNIVKHLREKLESTKLREFYKSNDSIVFIVDGFLDDSWGYFYSAKTLNDTDDFRFEKYTIHYVEDVNEHWKKASIAP